MKDPKKPWFPLLGALVSAVFFLATAYLWYGFWRTEKMKAVEEQSLKVGESDFPPTNASTSTQVTATSTLPSATSTSTLTPTSTETKPTTTTVRTAVSPLTGTLVLKDSDVNLNVPYTSQAPERNWADPWQNACEEAAILMIDAYVRGYSLSPLSAKDELLRMVAWEDEQKMYTSINAEGVKKIFTEYLHYSRPVRIVENPDALQIKAFLDQGKAVLALAYGKTLPNRYYSNGGPDYHAFVIRGYTADKFITNDPGVNRGANFVFPIDDVIKSLHDWNGGDVRNGTPVIIVVE